MSAQHLPRRHARQSSIIFRLAKALAAAALAFLAAFGCFFTWYVHRAAVRFPSHHSQASIPAFAFGLAAGTLCGVAAFLLALLFLSKKRPE